MSQSFAKIIGSIKQNVPFYMGKVVDKIPNILVYSKSSTEQIISYNWSSDDKIIETNGAIFTATYAQDPKTENFAYSINYIYDTINKRYILSGLNNPPFSSKPDTKPPLIVENINGIYWSYPNIYLCSISYSIITCSDLNCSKSCCPQVDVYFIPVDIYLKFTEADKCVSNENFDMYSSIIWKNNENLPSETDFYWSNIDDCKTNVYYEYCKNQLCGYNNCRGACFSNDSVYNSESIWYDCNYNTNDKNFKCVENQNTKDFFDKSKLSVGIIILIVVGVLILLIGISLVVYFTIKKRRKKKTDDSDIDLLLASTAYPSAAYPSTAYPSTAYPSTAYPSAAYPSAYPSTSYPSAAYPFV